MAKSCLDCIHSDFEGASYGGCETCGYGEEDGRLVCRKGMFYDISVGSGKREIVDASRTAENCEHYAPEPWAASEGGA